jgi:hypothetical protein
MLVKLLPDGISKGRRFVDTINHPCGTLAAEYMRRFFPQKSGLVVFDNGADDRKIFRVVPQSDGTTSVRNVVRGRVQP